MATSPQDAERIRQLQAKSEQKVPTNEARRPWQEAMHRYTTVPASKAAEAAEVIAGLAGSWTAFYGDDLGASHQEVTGDPIVQVKSYKLGQPGLPELNFVPYQYGTNRFGPKGPSLLGHPINLSIVGPTVKSPAMDWQWIVTDNSGTPNGDVLEMDIITSIYSPPGGPDVPPTCSTIQLAYNFSAVTDFKGGLYMVVSQTGWVGEAPVIDSGLSDGYVIKAAGGIQALKPRDFTSKYEIFKINRVVGTQLYLEPNKRLVDYFEFPAGPEIPYIRAVTIFEPWETRLVAVPGSGEGVGRERAFVVVPPERCATGEYLPPYDGTNPQDGTWVEGGFDRLHPTIQGATATYSNQVANPIPRPLEHRRGRLLYTSEGPPLGGRVGWWYIFGDGVPGHGFVATDVGKVIHIHRYERVGTAPLDDAGGIGQTIYEDAVLGWFEIVDGNAGSGLYQLRRIEEVDPYSGVVTYGSPFNLAIDDSSLTGDLFVNFTVHDPISALHAATYNDPDQVDSARLRNLIDPGWVERTSKLPTLYEGISSARADKAIWNTDGGDPGSLLDLGFRMVLFPAKEGAGTFVGQMVPDYDHPINSREVTLDPSVTDEAQFLDVDYSAGMVTLSHAPVPGTGCDVAPNGIVASDNPREEIVLFAACVPYSMEQGQLGGGVRVISAAVAGAGCSTGLDADVYGGRVVNEMATLIGGAPSPILSGVGLTLNLEDDISLEIPPSGFVEIRNTSDTGTPVFTGPGGEPLGIYGYYGRTTQFDIPKGKNYTRLEGVYGGGLYGVDAAVGANKVAVLRRDIRTPATNTNLAGTHYEHDLTYGFSKRTTALRFDGAGVTTLPDGSTVIENASYEADVLVGGTGTSGCTAHFPTLAEAVQYVSSVADPGPGRSWRILVVGSTVETTAPIAMPTDGLIIQGAMLREDSGTATISWGSDTPLIDFNGKSNIVFEDLAFEFTGAGVHVTPDRVVFTNTDVNPATRCRVRNCRMLGAAIQGFAYVAAGGIEDCTFEENFGASTDFGIYVTGAFSVLNNTFQNNHFSQTGTTQAVAAGGVDIVANSFGDLIFGNKFTGYDLGIRTYGSWGAIRDNEIASTATYGVDYGGQGNFRIDGNDLFAVYSDPSPKVGILVRSNVVTGMQVSVTHNRIDISGAGAADRGVHTQDTGGRVVGNSTDAGIEVASDNVVADNLCESVVFGASCTVKGNTVQTTIVGSGVTNNVMVLDNIVLAASGTGIQIGSGANVLVRGNNLSAGPSTIDVTGPDAKVEVNACDDILVFGSGAGVIGNYVDGGIAITGDRPRVADNHIVSTQTVIGACAIGINGQECVVSNNLQAGAGIGLDVSPGFPSTTDWIITGNRFVGNIQGTALIVNSVIGDNMCQNIQFLTGTSITVSGNRCSGPINILGGASSDGNTISGNRATQVNLTGDDNVVDGNKITTIMIVQGDGNIVSDNEPTSVSVQGQSNRVDGNMISSTLTVTVNAQNDPGGVLSNNIVGVDIVIAGGPDNTVVDGNIVTDDITFSSTVPPGRDNIFSNNVVGDDVNLTTSPFNIVDGNHIGGALSASGGSNRITGNYIAGNINLGGSLGDVIDSNRFANLPAVTGGSHRITGNICGVITLDGADETIVDGNELTQVVLDDTTSALTTVTISDNLFTGGGGANINGSTLGNTSNIFFIHDNYIEGYVDMGESEDVTINGNMIEGGDAVNSAIQGTGLAERWTIIGNRINPGSSQGLSNVAERISLVNTTGDHTFIGNYCGQILVGTSTDCVFIGNNCYGIDDATAVIPAGTIYVGNRLNTRKIFNQAPPVPNIGNI